MAKKKQVQPDYNAIAAKYNELFKKMDSGEIRPKLSIKWHNLPEGKNDLGILSDPAGKLNKSITYNYNKNIEITEQEYGKLNSELYRFRKIVTDTGTGDIETVRHLQNEFADMLHSIDFALGVRIRKGAVINGEIDQDIEDSHNQFKEYLKEIRPAVGRVLDSELSRLEKLITQDGKAGEKEPARKLPAKICALSYIFDLYAKGQQLPIRPVDGSFDGKEMERIGDSRYGIKGHTFYHAVTKRDIGLIYYDLNKKIILNQISANWYNEIMELTEDKQALTEYLVKQELIEE
ncbi:MAG: hypothetical protein J7502_16960 [Flavisolibacter sp.]|nr:hypothetical protein [Flavisolibacter sp.]